MNQDFLRRVILVALLGAFAALAYAVLESFLIPVAWAGILAYVTWPAYRRLRIWLRGKRALSALLMTLILSAAFVLPLIGLIAIARAELPVLHRILTEQLTRGFPPLPAQLRDLPYLGPWLDGHWQHFVSDPNNIKVELETLLRNSATDIAVILGGVGRNIAKFALALLTVFFMFRDGESIYDQIRHVLRRFLGPAVDGYIAAVGLTTKAVVYGIFADALAQGLVAGIGYWWAGLPTPMLLSAVTFAVALIPFGAPLVWVSAGVWLLINGQIGAGVGLLLWGAMAVSWIDNLVRPLVISHEAHIPFLIVLFGVLGGLAAFGLIGLFVGPVILAVLLAIWREWLEESTVWAA